MRTTGPPTLRHPPRNDRRRPTTPPGREPRPTMPPRHPRSLRLLVPSARRVRGRRVPRTRGPRRHHGTARGGTTFSRRSRPLPRLPSDGFWNRALRIPTIPWSSVGRTMTCGERRRRASLRKLRRRTRKRKRRRKSLVVPVCHYQIRIPAQANGFGLANYLRLID